MISLSPRPKCGCSPLEHKQIENRLNGASCLPSLGSIESALKERIERGPAIHHPDRGNHPARAENLTARLLRLVNSVYYGLTNPIKNIEEAVFFWASARFANWRW